MANAHRLNGWHRLWIALVILYALAVVTIAYLVSPNRGAIASAWSSEVFRLIEADVNRSSRLEISAAQFRASKDFDGKTDEQIAREMTQGAKEIDIADPEKKDLLQYKQEVAELASEYEAKLGELPARQFKHATTAFIIWLVPSLGLLLLGHAAAWIIRGFRLS